MDAHVMNAFQRWRSCDVWIDIGAYSLAKGYKMLLETRKSEQTDVLKLPEASGWIPLTGKTGNTHFWMSD